MLRQHSNTSSMSGSTVSPRGRLNFIKKGIFGSSHEASSSEKIYEVWRLPFIPHQLLTGPQAPASDKIVNSSPFTMPELEITRSSGGLPSPDPFIGATHDTEFLHLRENSRRIRKAPSGPDPKKVDAVWEVYKKLREESLQLCKSLLKKSRKSDPVRPYLLLIAV